MDNLISFAKVLEHAQLSERLLHLRATLHAAQVHAPKQLASPLLARASAVLLADIYRLISREPGARTLPRLDRLQPPEHRHLTGMLRDAQLALDLFRQAHSDDEGDNEWRTIEGEEMQAEHRAAMARS
ncbi:hypothetical protein [Devosia alba]|uniref:hypothetical protein n=1 Tax=Devosia alba TaxID=3152360 RepID=UPI0032642E9E